MSDKDVIPSPIEFRRQVEAGTDFIFKDLIESLSVRTPDGRSAQLHGFEQIHINYYSLEGESEIDQIVVIPESETPIIQRFMGNILTFSYPYIFKKDNSQVGGFRIVKGKGIIQFMGIAIITPSSDLIL
jgi:hypothetical protein